MWLLFLGITTLFRAALVFTFTVGVLRSRQLAENNLEEIERSPEALVKLNEAAEANCSQAWRKA